MGDKRINSEIDVLTGDIAVIKNTGIIRVTALGSCIAVLMYDKKNKIGGLAHILLPGKSPKNRAKEKFRYAENAIDELLRRMAALGSDCKKIVCGFVGAANVLKRENDTICLKNIKSVTDYLAINNIKVTGKKFGGINRMSVELHIDNGLAFYSVADRSKAIVLWGNDND